MCSLVITLKHECEGGAGERRQEETSMGIRLVRGEGEGIDGRAGVMFKREGS